MKRSIQAFVFLLCWGVTAWAAAPGTLTSVRAIKALTNGEARQGLPVAFDATVTFFRESESTLFVQDGGAAVYVKPPVDASFAPGDRVAITGKTNADFNADVVAGTITLLHHGTVPTPTPATFDQMNRGQSDCLLVTLRGVIRTVDLQKRSDTRGPGRPLHLMWHIQLQTDGGYVEALVDGADAGSLSDLLDDEVEATGVAGFGFDGKTEPIGVALNVTSRADIKVLQRAKVEPWSIPAIPMDKILSGYHVRDMTERIRVHGTITYYQRGSAIVIQDGAKSLWVSTLTRIPMEVGDSVDVIGFPDVHHSKLAITRAEIRDSHMRAPIAPMPATVRQLMASHNLYDLVSVEGEVATAVREASQDEYVLRADKLEFTAIYRHPDAAVSPFKDIPVGSTIRVTGICIQEDSNPFISQVPFDILMRTPDDIAVVANPTLITTRNLIRLVELLLAVVLAVGARGWFIERRVRRKTAALAYIERRRSRILEDINGSRPLSEIIEQITELTSCKLDGAACWCQIAGGAQLGNIPARLDGFRVVSKDIQAHSGPALGTIFAVFDPLSKARAVEQEALAMATALAALAIETRRLYSDLVYRSNFDELTNTSNRFSLEKRLDALIAEARETAGMFGVIYIDLDKFKQINDLHGHSVGDRFLQNVTLRMKGQLRSQDLLARLGGDEFAVLVPVVHNRAEVEEIAHRLERCLDDPLCFDEYILQGAASLGIAVYPEDGATKDILLKTADAAMYAAKNAHKQAERARMNLANI